MIQQIKNIVKKIIFNYIKPQTVPNSFSQAGEDSIINFLINDKKLKKFSYLEIGTNNPINHNNTYLFYTKGYNGVCVEADISFIENIKKNRPKDKVLNVGVSFSSAPIADFYIFNEPSLNTFDKLEAEYRQSQGTYKIVKVEKVALKTLENIIVENFETYPDYLSIDVEGLDLDILKSINFNKYPIPIICAETCTYSENHIRPKNNDIQDYMISKDYFVYADTYINTIFVNKSWFYNNK